MNWTRHITIFSSVARVAITSIIIPKINVLSILARINATIFLAFFQLNYFSFQFLTITFRCITAIIITFVFIIVAFIVIIFVLWILCKISKIFGSKLCPFFCFWEIIIFKKKKYFKKLFKIQKKNKETFCNFFF